MRSANGSNDHPTAKLFLQAARIFMTRKLLKVARGSNVTGSELLTELGERNEELVEEKETKSLWLEKIDEIFQDEIAEENDTQEQNKSAEEKEKEKEKELDEEEHSLDQFSWDMEHDYDVAKTSPYVIAYIAGYVARKAQKFSKCANCLNSLKVANSNDKNHEFIKLMSEGHLIYPSGSLENFIKKLEDCVLYVVGATGLGLRYDTCHKIIDTIIRKKDEVPKVGCAQHFNILTKKILLFYVLMRCCFLANSYNSIYCEKKEKSKNLKKLAKNN